MSWGKIKPQHTRGMTRHQRWYGMNWISQCRRLAIYLRDGLQCLYCLSGVLQGARLTLDHIKPVQQGGTHKSTNLITACATCNGARGTRSVREFALDVAGYTTGNGSRRLAAARKIIERIATVRRRKPDISAAKELVAIHGSATKALKIRSPGVTDNQPF